MLSYEPVTTPQTRGFCTLVALVVLFAASHAFAADKVDSALRAALTTNAPAQPVIISVNPGCRPNIRQALEQHGDAIRAEHTLIDAVSARVHSSDIDALAKSACVKSVAIDATVHASATTAQLSGAVLDASATLQTTTTINTLRDTLGLPHTAAQNTSFPTGAGGLGAAIIDSGIQPNSDFTGRITGFWDFTRGGIATVAYDDYGHGTHIAGLVGSSGKLSNYEYQGIAPDIKLIGLKVLDSQGAGKTSDVISAIEFVVTNRSKLNVQIVNLSLGHPIFSRPEDDPLVQAVEMASQAGLYVVVSAGNFGMRSDGTTGYAGITSPGNAHSAITIGATDTLNTTTRQDDSVAAYSSRGPTWYEALPKPDLVSPGTRLASDAAIGSTLYNAALSAGKIKKGDQLLVLSGTSMGTGVASGVVALILQAHNQNGFHKQRAITPNFMKALLQYSAIPLVNTDRLTQGTGEINAAGAITLARAIDTSRPVGSWWLATSVSSTSTIGKTPYAWASDILWGENILWGESIYWNAPSWGQNILWGENVVWSGNILWGENIIWGENILWGENIIWGENLVGMIDGTNILWGENIVWGELNANNIVWGEVSGSNILWGDNVVWGESVEAVY